MYKTILMILALLMATLSAPVWARDYCSDDWVCFGVNWETATPEDVRGIDPNAKDVYGRTPLYAAASTNNIPAIIALLQAGANANMGMRWEQHYTESDWFDSNNMLFDPYELMVLIEFGALDLSLLRALLYADDAQLPAIDYFIYAGMRSDVYDNYDNGDNMRIRHKQILSLLSDATGRDVNEVINEALKGAIRGVKSKHPHSWVFDKQKENIEKNLADVRPTPDEAKRIAAEVKQEFYEKYGHLLPEGAAGQNQASETSAEKHPSCRYPDQGKRFADSELIELDAVSRTKDKVYQSGECVYGSGMAADAAECVVETKIWEGEFLYTPGAKCKKSVGDISVCTTTNYASDKYRCGIKYHNGYYSSLSDSSPVIKVKDPAKGYKDRFAACFEPYKLMLTKGVDKDEYKCIGDPQNE